MNLPFDSALRIAELLKSDAPIKWLFAGDSITQGALHTFGHRDYSEHFSERIRWELRRKRDNIINTGVSGWRVGDLETDLEWSVLQYSPHIVSLNIGMNDCSAGHAGLADFSRIYGVILKRIAASTDSALILHVPNLILQAPVT